jgi:hypothetical protein
VKSNSADFKALAITHLLDDGSLVIGHGELSHDSTEIFMGRVADLVPTSEIYWYCDAAEEDRTFELQQVYGPVITGLRSQGKLCNAQNMAIHWNRGKIFVPDEWRKEDNSPLTQILRFTGHEGTHDDFVDALSVAIDQLTGRDYSATASIDLVSAFLAA